MLDLRRPNLLTAAYPTDGLSVGALVDPIPSRVAGSRDPATGAGRVALFDDGRGTRPLVPGAWLKLRPSVLPAVHDWGRDSHGARLLAFELLAELLGIQAARRLRRPFLDDHVARWPGDRWAMLTIDVMDWTLGRGGLS